MSLTLFNSIGWAVEKQTITDGGGLTGPVLVSAVSNDPNTVRLTFDRKLMLEYRQAGVYHAQTLDLSSFTIHKVSDSTPLEVVRTSWINDTTIDLATANQQASNYQVTCVAGGVMDFWGNTISLQTATFTGQQKADYTTPETLHAFTSGYAGMQENEPVEFYPDIKEPTLSSQDPAPAEVEVPLAHTVAFDLNDNDDYDTGVQLSSVRVWVEGNLAYRGDTDSFVAPYNGPASACTGTAPSYQFVIEKVGGFGQYETVVVRVLASDLAPITNTLDTSYAFRTTDTEPPYLANLSPDRSAIDIVKDTDISLDVIDDGIGLLSSSVWIKINGVYAWLSESQQSGFVVTKTPITNGFRYLIDPDVDFTSYETVSVQVHADDLETSPNELLETYTFRTVDTEDPFLQNENPAPDDYNVNPATNIYAEIEDVGAGVDLSTVIAWVLGDLAYRGDTNTFLAPYNGPGSSMVLVGSAYKLTLDRTTDFDEYLDVSVQISAQDLATIPNTLDTTYYFRTWDISGPIVDLHAPIGTNVSRSAAVILSVDENSGSGVSLPTLKVWIDDVLALDGDIFQPGFDGPGSTLVPHHLGYDILIQPLTEFPSFEVAHVDVYVEDVVGNITSYTWSFQIEDYLGPLIETIYPHDEDVNIPEATNVSFRLSDLDAVVASSIRVNVEQGGVWAPAFDWTQSPKFCPGYNGPGSSVTEVGGVYTIVIDPKADFPKASRIHIEVLAADPTGNPARL